nr:DUF547 domain-containing protein [Motiliproteus sediminis]
MLERTDPSTLSGANAKKAFYINAYNILAIDLVLKHWPVESIRDIGSWIRPVWRREAGKIAGEPVTLHQVEHEILRPMGDPRIHMAIVCASLSCPDLAARPYRGSALEQQLDHQTRLFLSNPKKGAAERGEALAISKIFDWFAADFESGGGVRAWLRRYGVMSEADTLRYLPYDWRVNGS